MKKVTTKHVGEGIRAENASWTFKGETAMGFSDHVRKSVPMYDEGHELITKISDFFVHDESICYELGTSTGTLLSKLAYRHKNKTKVKWVGIDNSFHMIEKAKKDLDPNIKNITFVNEDITSFKFEPCDLMISYYTIQFVPPYIRQELINKIYQNLNWGGAFLFFEKVRSPDARFQDYMTAIYTDYKLEQGYSSEEIVNKSRSLKRVLEPFSTQGNLDLMKRAGFVDIMTVMKWACFEGFLAIK